MTAAASEQQATSSGSNWAIKHPLVRVREVSRVFDSGVPTTALREATFDIWDGEFVAIVGPSGAGKSTLLNILGLLDVHTAGDYYLDGVNVRDLTEKELNHFRSNLFGFVFQNSHVLPHEPAALNAALGLRVQGRPHEERRRLVSRVLRQFGLEDRAGIQGRLLSGGERQRLAIARAVASEPRIILADEPTGNLDSYNSARVIEDLRRLSDQGVTVVVITHDDRVADAADRRLTLIDGVVSGPSVDAEPKVLRGAASILGHHPHARQSKVRRYWDNVADSLNSLTVRPFRTALLLFAFLLGAGGLVAASGFSQTTSAQISERLTQAALDEVRLSDSRVPQGELPSEDHRREVRETLTALNGVEEVGLTSIIPPADAEIHRLPAVGANGFDGPVELADSRYFSLIGAQVVPSNGVQLMDGRNEIPAAILGREAAEELGVAKAGPNVIIWVQEQPVPVVGILDRSNRDSAAAAKVYLNPEAAKEVSNLSPVFVIRTTPGFPAPLKDAIPLALDPAAPASINVQTVADLRDLRRGVGSDLGTMVAIISLVLLTLACLTAATAMYLSVQARTSEIALRRALGTSRVTIANMFLLEGVFVGLAGGLAGAVLGLVSVVSVSAVQGWTPVLDGTLPLLGILCGGVTGALAAAYPALVAARADPAQALRA